MLLLLLLKNLESGPQISDKGRNKINTGKITFLFEKKKGKTKRQSDKRTTLNLKEIEAYRLINVQLCMFSLILNLFDKF